MTFCDPKISTHNELLHIFLKVNIRKLILVNVPGKLLLCFTRIKSGQYGMVGRSLPKSNSMTFHELNKNAMAFKALNSNYQIP